MITTDFCTYINQNKPVYEGLSNKGFMKVILLNCNSVSRIGSGAIYPGTIPSIYGDSSPHKGCFDLKGRVIDFTEDNYISASFLTLEASKEFQFLTILGEELVGELNLMPSPPNLQVLILKTKYSKDLPLTEFEILDWEINKTAFKILIEYQSEGNPDIQAYWDEVKEKLFLVGCKIDPSCVVKIINGPTIPKMNLAWISMNLTSLNIIGKLNIYKKISEDSVKKMATINL